jgi:hypothetical protein
MAFRLIPLLLVLAGACSAGCGGTAKPASAQPRTSAAPTTVAQRGWIPDGPRDRAVVWAVGDGAGGDSANPVARLIQRAKPDLFLYLGDVYPMGTRSAFQTGYAPTFGPLAKLTAPTPGNHDWPVRSEGYNPYWMQAHGGTTPPYYSLRAGGWQLLALNSETDDHAGQLAWLKSQLKGPGDCRLAFWHRPRFSGGTHGDASDMDPYWRALQNHARLVLSGHDHDMQRFRARGTLTQLVSGAGGKSHYPIDRSHPGLAFANDSVYGALRLELRPGSARISFHAAGGRRLDTSTVRCKRG